MSQRHTNYVRAFTIVELLVVIVVLAILASVTVVAYMGVKNKASNVQILEGVRQYYTALQLYQSSNGGYPKTTGEVNGDNIAMTCLGTGYAGGTCGVITGTQIYEDATFNTAMKSIISSVPAIGKNLIAVGGENFTGAAYGIDVTSTTPRGRVLEYALYGANADCKLPGSYSYNVSSSPPTTACEIYLEAYP